MAYRKFIAVDNDGYVISTVEGDISNPVSPGLIEVPVETNLRSVVFKLYDPETEQFGSRRPVRSIPRGTFMDRFTPTEQAALEEVSESNNQAGRLVRVFTRRLEAEANVNLDSPALVAALGQIRTILTTAGVTGWTTQQSADARVAAILASG